VCTVHVENILLRIEAGSYVRTRLIAKRILANALDLLYKSFNLELIITKLFFILPRTSKTVNFLVSIFLQELVLDNTLL
jgi:hypothetical protein